MLDENEAMKLLGIPITHIECANGTKWEGRLPAAVSRYLRECTDDIASLRAENERLREALEAMDTKLEVESSFEERGETYVAFYRVPAGPWHKILGLIRG